jgi:hypothetical protein
VKYRVDINGHMIIIDAHSEKQARAEAIADLVTVRVSKATEEDIDWYDAMTGAKP